MGTPVILGLIQELLYESIPSFLANQRYAKRDGKQVFVFTCCHHATAIDAEEMRKASNTRLPDSELGTRECVI